MKQTSAYFLFIKCDFPVEAFKMDYFAYSRLLMLMVSGKKVSKLSFLFLGLFGFTSGWYAPGHRKHTLGVGLRGTLGTSGAPVSSYRPQSSEAEQEWGVVDAAVKHHLLIYTVGLIFFWFFFSSLFLNRYRNMGNLLKVLTCTDLEQEPNFFLDFESEFFF